MWSAWGWVPMIQSSLVMPYCCKSARMSSAALCSPASMSTAAVSVTISSLSPCPTSRKWTVQLPVAEPPPVSASSPPNACCMVSVRYCSASSSEQPPSRGRAAAVRIAAIFWKNALVFVGIRLLWCGDSGFCRHGCVGCRIFVPEPPDSSAWCR